VLASPTKCEPHAERRRWRASRAWRSRSEPCSRPERSLVRVISMRWEDQRIRAHRSGGRATPVPRRTPWPPRDSSRPRCVVRRHRRWRPRDGKLVRSRIWLSHEQHLGCIRPHRSSLCFPRSTLGRATLRRATLRRATLRRATLRRATSSPVYSTHSVGWRGRLRIASMSLRRPEALRTSAGTTAVRSVRCASSE